MLRMIEIVVFRSHLGSFVGVPVTTLMILPRVAAIRVIYAIWNLARGPRGELTRSVGGDYKPPGPTSNQ